MFPGNVTGLAFTLSEDSVGVVFLNHPDAVKAGDRVRRTGRVVDVPVGERLLGRVIDPLGNPMDGGGRIVTVNRRKIEREAYPIMARSPVATPLQTGIKAIDSFTPIGRGQRELILGDRQTGKTALAIDTIINQKNTGDRVRRTGRVVDVPVGERLLGRVIDPLGNPMDGGGRIVTVNRRKIEREAYPIMARSPVATPLQTGIKAIDSFTPIGRGQRELILGDRQTGKTALAIDTIINQKNTGVRRRRVASRHQRRIVRIIAGRIEKTAVRSVGN